jgi:DNA polymerase-1
MNDILIVDSNNVAYRVWSAITTPLTNQGKDISVVYGFLKSFISWLKNDKLNATMIIFVWDFKKSKRRKQIYPEYKANRDSLKNEAYFDFLRQCNEIYKLMELLPVRQLKKEYIEGDDLISAVCQLYPECTKMILSGDGDLAQLIDENTSMYKLGRSPDQHRVITKDNFSTVSSKCSIPYNRMIDYKVLNGDKTDNITGITGVGDKTIERILNEFPSIEDFMLSVEEGPIDGRLKSTGKKLFDNFDIIERNRLLVDLQLGLDEEILEFSQNKIGEEKEFKSVQFKSILIKYNFMSIVANYLELVHILDKKV